MDGGSTVASEFKLPDELKYLHFRCKDLYAKESNDTQFENPYKTANKSDFINFVIGDSQLNKCHRIYYIEANLSKNHNKVEMIRNCTQCIIQNLQIIQKIF